MNITQTREVVLGAVAALNYALAVGTVGWVVTWLLITRSAKGAIRLRLGPFGLMWISFVMGQGLLGGLWLTLATAAELRSRTVLAVCLTGWLLGMVLLLKRSQQFVESARVWLAQCALEIRSFYFWLATGVFLICILKGIISLIPTVNDDALQKYFVIPRVIADTQVLKLQPFVQPFYGLLPLQVEMHWAALFAVSNESAVCFWDYICAMSVLCGVGLLAWNLTRSSPVSLVAILMMLSTPGFSLLIGAGKVDNAAVQYGIGAFIVLCLWPELGGRSTVLAGLLAGWAIASRYTDVIMIPGLVLFAIAVGVRPTTYRILWSGIGMACAGAPMLFKNQILTGCVLAPHFGCRDTFWAGTYQTIHSGPQIQNIAVSDLLAYPFVWTFSGRDNMLGNLSPLFLGFSPFLLLSFGKGNGFSTACSAGLAGIGSLMTWIVLKPLVLFTRWLLIPLGLLSIPLSSAFLSAEGRASSTVRWCMRVPVLLVLLFLLFESRSVVHAVRYVFAIDSRATRYMAFPRFGYDVASWLNTRAAGERVSLSGYRGSKYFIKSSILLNSESEEELQWIWDRRHHVSIPDLWKFYAQRGLLYVVLSESDAFEAKANVPEDLEVEPVFVSTTGHVVLKIRRQATLALPLSVLPPQRMVDQLTKVMNVVHHPPEPNCRRGKS